MAGAHILERWGEHRAGNLGSLPGGPSLTSVCACACVCQGFSQAELLPYTLPTAWNQLRSGTTGNLWWNRLTLHGCWMKPPLCGSQDPICQSPGRNPAVPAAESTGSRDSYSGYKHLTLTEGGKVTARFFREQE